MPIAPRARLDTDGTARHMHLTTSIRNRRRDRGPTGLVLTCLLALGAIAIPGCGNNNNQNDYGTAFLTVSSAPGSFASYIATVVSITLTRSDGAVVSLTQGSEIIDFAQLNGISELYAATLIPIGTYTSATVNLDYTGAAVAVSVGGVLKSATVVDAAGAAITSVAVTTTFDPKNPLVIIPIGGQRIDLNFNLNASNTLNTAVSPIKVTAQPFITMSNSPAVAQPIRIRGPLISFNTIQQTVTVYARPFHDVANNFGTVSLFASPSTTYAIDYLGFTGAAGLTAITNVTTGTVIAGYTTYTPDPNNKGGTFNVSQLFVGNALESGLLDVIEGTVISRSGNTLKLRDATYSNRNGVFAYEIVDPTVTVAASTVVTEDGAPAATGLNENSISVGQHIVALGQSTVATSGLVSMDTTAGQVRLAPTRVWGALLSSAAGSASIDVQAIGQLPPAVFTFTGTGKTAAQNAEPADYLLDTGGVDLTGQTAGTHLAADGLVSPFGSAPPDFNATAVTAATSLDASLDVDWVSTGTNLPFSVASSADLVINLANTALGTVHTITLGPNLTDLKSLAASPTIVADAALKSQFALGSAAEGTSTYATFSDFVAKIDSDSSKPAVRFQATGRYDAATNTFTANSINLVKE
jgi:hypothetical protein